MSKGGSDKKVANSLVAVSCAAVLAVYSAGYSRTRAAASQFEAQSAERRPAAPGQTHQGEPTQSEASPLVARSAAPVAVGSGERAPIAVQAPAGEATTAAPAQEIVATVEAPAEAPVASVAPVAPAPIAPAPAPAPPPPPPPTPPPAPKWKDGAYTGWGTSRHGDIQAEVVIEGGRIQGATIAQCLTRYSCDVIDMLPPQVAARQSADVDYVSRATESANAFYYAVVDALNKAATHK